MGVPMLNTRYNKATYSALVAALFVFASALCVQFNVIIKPELWAAAQGLAQAFISFLVPNKETPPPGD